MEQIEKDLDVAISFANEDLPLASAIRDKLGPTLDVFVYTAKQEELAGTDGLESFRRAFRYRARLVVILFREKWGKTPWTQIEEQAITDRFLKEGPDFLFVVMLDSSMPPPWLPEKLIRFNLQDFGIEQAVGAIKARALERGSVIHRPSPADLARQAEVATEFFQRRSQLLGSEGGVRQVQREVDRLWQLMEERATAANTAAPSLRIEFGKHPVAFGFRTPNVGLHVSYRNNIANSLNSAQLVIREFSGSIILPGQNAYYAHEPKALDEFRFKPDLGRAEGWGWQRDEEQLQTSEAVADFCIGQFLSLVRRHAAGELPSSW